ncbi:hypothetical protein SAMN05660895_0166 [Thermoflavifilum thermophilum]|uniref:Uncharacterized protein n=1 Tax=Thermoflavifilum thermophilum TaxID=1393122 RepID=A0A1I7MZ96_9BACT|nr:hypothetical protein SAMN05660895_0166 [Thermoflavifilum thermophilum]
MSSALEIVNIKQATVAHSPFYYFFFYFSFPEGGGTRLKQP